jgi:hypothetical protein
MGNTVPEECRGDPCIVNFRASNIESSDQIPPDGERLIMVWKNLQVRLEIIHPPGSLFLSQTESTTGACGTGAHTPELHDVLRSTAERMPVR